MARTAKKKIQILDEGVIIADDVDSLDFTGSGVSGSAINQAVTETISGGSGGGGGVTFETPSGTVNGINTVFTVINVPVYIVSDGTTYFPNSGYTRIGLTITMDVPPTSFIKSAY